MCFWSPSRPARRIRKGCGACIARGSVSVRRTIVAEFRIERTGLKGDRLMRGMMMDYPLTLRHFLVRNQRLYRDKEVVSRTPSGLHRYTYAEYGDRVGQLANALSELGVQRG